MGKKEKIISIYNYIDYRKFISDFFEYLKERDGMTLRLFAKKAGFSAHAFLKQVIEGKKSASIQSAFKIARGFDLNEDETLFLETLIRFDLATELEDKNEIYKKIIKVKPKDELTKIEKDHFNLFSNWYVFAIREMIIMPEFKEDFEWIAKSLCPNITKMQAEEAIEILLKLGFIKRNDNGKLEQVSLNISTGPEVKSIHVFNYHNNMLGLTSYAMNKTESQFRDISSMSFAINKTEFQYLKKRIAEFRKEILQYLADRKKGIFPEENAGLESVLYNLNIHLFNSTKIKWKK